MGYQSDGYHTQQEDEPEDLPEHLRPVRPRQSVSAEAHCFDSEKEATGFVGKPRVFYSFL